MLTTNVLCMKKRKKRRYRVANVSDHGQGSASDKRSPGSAVTMMHITEDTPPDMLAGAMDLTVHLPNGRSVKMSVERSTPMMDLLVQIVTAHQLQLSGHIIQALEMAPSAEISDKVLPYKPNTPIGALDTQHIKVVPKNRNIPMPKNVPSGHQPFESTFRLKVHLPRNQLYVTRVSQNVYLEDIMHKVCKEKNLDPSKYEFRHPGNLDEVLDPKLTLSDYQITEIYVVSKGTGRLTQAFSTSDIMALRKEEERKQFQAKTGGGVFNLIFKRGKSNPANGSISSDNRSISPSHSDDSRSVTPPAIQPPPAPVIKDPPPERPKPPQRKRRPAPKPPQVPQEETKPEKPDSQISNNSNQSDGSAKKADSGLLICHSRNSSDSSGYHEASILSDNCNTSLPRRPKTMIESEDVNNSKLSGEHSRSTGNLAKASAQYKSTSSLALHGRKKKAAPPPPRPPSLSVPKVEASITKPEITSPVVASQPVENPPESVSTVPTIQTPPESITSSVLPPSTPASTLASARTSQSNLHSTSTDKVAELNPKDSQESHQIIEDVTEENKQTESDMNLIINESKNEADSGICEKEDLELETWQYQLPSPPKAFRDASPMAATTISQFDTETLPDSVVTNPELFEKLQYVKDIQDIESDIPSIISEEEKEMCNKLTLEHLEKRKSLVYNRELATSLKFAQENDSSEKKNFSTIKSNVINELEDVITNSSSNNNNNNRGTNNMEISTKLEDNFRNTTLDRNLPNFQISSYDTKKEKINIFEDDSIRSNVNLSRSNSQLASNIHKVENIPENNLDTIQNAQNLKHTNAVSLENISTLKDNTSPELISKIDDKVFKKPQEISTYRLKNSFYDKSKNINSSINNGHVSRSGSFSVNDVWTPANPIKRSKSQVTLNKYKEDSKDDVDGCLSKSSSLLDVCNSLQSLQVMKNIQTKLSNSKEELDNIKVEVAKVNAEPKPVVSKTSLTTTSTTTNYVVRGPPSVNLGTWSQRPKSQVMVKEDTDYKFNTINTKVNSSNYENDYKRNSALKPTSSFNTYTVNNTNSTNSHRNSNGVSIKVNGSEAISSQKSGNVVIKIGSNETDNSTRFINHIMPEGYRKPLGNINKIDRSRPHSIAFDDQFDQSRVPVVRAVELKKPYKDLQNNKSITQIYSNNIKINEDEPKSLNYSNSHNSDVKNENKPSNVYLNNESINSKPVVFRNNSFTPVVKGFRTDSNTSVNRKIWSVYGTLPAKPENHNELNTNRNVPFSQMNLRRTESNKILNSNTQINSNNNVFNDVVLRNNNFRTIIKDDTDKVEQRTIVPPPPQIPKENSIKLSRPLEKSIDSRAELLSAIRNFGGKKGLRASKG